MPVVELFEPFAQPMDIDPGGGVIGLGHGLAEYRFGDFRLRCRVRFGPAGSEEFEQIVQAPGTADEAAFTDSGDLSRKAHVDFAHRVSRAAVTCCYGRLAQLTRIGECGSRDRRQWPNGRQEAMFEARCLPPRNNTLHRSSAPAAAS